MPSLTFRRAMHFWVLTPCPVLLVQYALFSAAEVLHLRRFFSLSSLFKWPSRNTGGLLALRRTSGKPTRLSRLPTATKHRAPFSSLPTNSKKLAPYLFRLSLVERESFSSSLLECTAPFWSGRPSLFSFSSRPSPLSAHRPSCPVCLRCNASKSFTSSVSRAE